MRVVVQRVVQASVSIEGGVVASIGRGLLILVGVENGDTADDAAYLAGKTARLRIFDDSDGVMNLDVSAAGGEALVVSQFTLLASTKKGNRPSYVRSAPEAVSRPLYEEYASQLAALMGREVPTGRFGADMLVSLCNDGPVTIVMDSKRKDI